LRLTIPNIVSVVHQFLKDNDSIDEVYYRVFLVDAIYHQKVNWWTVSVEKVNKYLLEKEIIRNNIQVMLNQLNIKAITYVMKYDQLFWILININESKEKSTNSKLKTPFFFTIAPGKVSHIFYRPQNVNNKFIKIVMKSIGAKHYKPYELTGKHLQSMINVLQDKNKENELNPQELSNNFKEENVRKYVQQLFGDKPCLLDRFIINVESDYSMFSNTYPPGKICKTKVELRGDSVIDGIKDMMLSGILQPPYANWIKRLPVLGRNSININLRL